MTTAVATGLVDALPSSRPMTTEELAEVLKLPPDRVARTVRALATIGVVEVQGGNVRLTDLGRGLASDAPRSLGSMARMLHLEGWASWTAFPDWLRGATADGDVFDRFDQSAEDYAVFDAQMRTGSARHAPAVVAAADLQGAATVLDVGGGSGGMAREILQTYPGIRVTIGDRAYARTGANEFLASVSPERWSFVELDFFAGIPGGHDVYLLSRILHDWDDDKALAILRTCAAAMSSDARLLIFERSVSGDPEMAFALADLNTGLMCGGRERTVDEFADLISAAGMRLDKSTEVLPEHWLLEARTA